MGINWTSDQESAITTDNCNVMVAAAAGSGKTAVLVERIIRKITGGDGAGGKPPTDIDRLFVTTFTNAAATKMKKQIGEAIAERLEEYPTDKNLQRQYALVNTASICNLHAFCLDIVRQNFHILGISPDFSVADPAEMEIVKKQVADALLDEMFEIDESENEGFFELARAYGTQRGYDKLIELMLKVHSYVMTMPFPQKWLDNAAAMFELSGGFGESLWIKTITEDTKLCLERCADLIHQAILLTNESPEIGAYLTTLVADKEIIRKLAMAADGGWDEMVEMLGGKLFSDLTPVRKVEDSVKKPVQDLRNRVKKEIGKLAEGVYNASEADITHDMRLIAPRIHALGELVGAFGARFAAEKRGRNTLDFSDFEHMCLQALSDIDADGNITPSPLALTLQAKYDEILIDEYQDTNDLQETIFSLISSGGNVFMVGDIKQSIYRFRHTNPMLFKHKKDTFTIYKDGDAGMIDRKIIMSQNFRSRNEIIDSVNFIFRQITSQTVGEIDYDEEERLNCGAKYLEDGDVQVDRRVEVRVVDMSAMPQEDADDTKTDSERLDAEEVTAVEAEAANVAARIQQLMSEPFMVADGGDYRRCKYSDIVVLMRSAKTQAPVFAEVFARHGIPAFADAGGGYFMAQEVQLMLAVLEITDNPMQDIPLLAVMRSQIGGFTDEELLNIRMTDKDGCIYDAVEKTAAEASDIAKKCGAFLQRLAKWRGWASYMAVHELIWRLYDDTLFYGYAGAMYGGEQRQSNLRLLYERARGFEKSSFKGLFAFINYIKRMRSSNGDMSGAKLLGENQDVVRIMTVHKSKGLEFPIVFFSGGGKSFNMMDLNKSVLIHKELGLGPDFSDYTKSYKYPTIAKHAIRSKMRSEALSEELRLLYVALTRAKEKLIITFTAKDADKSMENWAFAAQADGEQLIPYRMADAKSFADWIMPAVLRCEGCSKLPPLNLPAWFTLKVVSSRDADSLDENSVADAEVAHEPRGEYSNIVRERLEYEYPFERVVKVPAKLSVTELKRIHNYDLAADAEALYSESMVERPAFIADDAGMSAAQKGSVMHFVMQNIDLRGAVDERGVREQIAGMVGAGVITKEQAAVVSAAKIAAFFGGELGRRMVRCGDVMREMPFEIEVSADAIYGGDFGGESVLLQGIIDCCFEEDGNMILVDYKTDYVHNNLDEIKEKYAVQLSYYAAAIEKITKKSVSRKYLYLFSTNSVIEYV